MLFPSQCVCCRSSGSSLCVSCRRCLQSAPCDAAVPAVFAFSGVGADLLRKLKYHNGRGVLDVLAEGLAALVPCGWGDVVTWAPTSVARKRTRGFDQAELLARALCRCLGLPCRQLLWRDSEAPQTGLGRRARLEGPSFYGRRQCVDRIVLVDDVVTTGATLHAASETLRSLGARDVFSLAVAATPPGKHAKNRFLGECAPRVLSSPDSMSELYGNT
jgi:ComF family protein